MSQQGSLKAAYSSSYGLHPSTGGVSTPGLQVTEDGQMRHEELTIEWHLEPAR